MTLDTVYLGRESPRIMITNITFLIVIQNRHGVVILRTSKKLLPINKSDARSVKEHRHPMGSVAALNLRRWHVQSCLLSDQYVTSFAESAWLSLPSARDRNPTTPTRRKAGSCFLVSLHEGVLSLPCQSSISYLTYLYT